MIIIFHYESYVLTVTGYIISLCFYNTLQQICELIKFGTYCIYKTEQRRQRGECNLMDVKMGLLPYTEHPSFLNIS